MAGLASDPHMSGLVVRTLPRFYMGLLLMASTSTRTLRAQTPNLFNYTRGTGPRALHMVARLPSASIRKL
eukprot:11180041-Lingulodinium_polyedra.AAC.1